MKNLISNINKGKVIRGLTVFAVAIIVIAIMTVNAVKTYNKVQVALPAIIFAYNNPEIVNPVKEQYELEYDALKDSIVKRQSMIGSESPKE